MLVNGRILDTDGAPIAGAKIDVLQTNDGGFYVVQQKGVQPDFNLRGVFPTSADGPYTFGGAHPRFSPIPDNGPLGKNGAHWAANPTAPRICTISLRPIGSKPL